MFERCDRRGISLLFAETIPISYCRRENGIEVLVCLCINCSDIICFLRLYRDVSLTVGGIKEDK